jgi:molybdopterin/thiamine biosynthesis adenylyltransferase
MEVIVPPAETPDMWQRNLGYVSPAEQESLAASRAAVLGLGGVGGVAAELLARAGVGRLVVCDADVFEASNLNRQVGALQSTLGQDKTQVMARRLMDINPTLELKQAEPLDLKPAQAKDALADCQAGVLAIDALGPALAALRAARALKVPLVEALGLPVVQVRSYAPDGPDPEEGLPSQGRELAEVDQAELARTWLERELPRLGDGQGGPLALEPDFLRAMLVGQAAPSLGPMVWLAGAAAALEVLKIILGRAGVVWWPCGFSLDPCSWQSSLA